MTRECEWQNTNTTIQSAPAIPKVSAWQTPTELLHGISEAYTQSYSPSCKPAVPLVSAWKTQIEMLYGISEAYTQSHSPSCKPAVPPASARQTPTELLHGISEAYTQSHSPSCKPAIPKVSAWQTPTELLHDTSEAYTQSHSPSCKPAEPPASARQTPAALRLGSQQKCAACAADAVPQTAKSCALGRNWKRATRKRSHPVSVWQEGRLENMISRKLRTRAKLEACHT